MQRADAQTTGASVLHIMFKILNVMVWWLLMISNVR